MYKRNIYAQKFGNSKNNNYFCTSKNKFAYLKN